MIRRRGDVTVRIYITVPDRPDLDLEDVELTIRDDDEEPISASVAIGAATELAADRGYLDPEVDELDEDRIYVQASGWAHPNPDETIETIELELTRRKLGWLLEAIETTTVLESVPAAPALAEAWAQLDAALREIDDEARSGG